MNRTHDERRIDEYIVSKRGRGISKNQARKSLRLMSPEDLGKLREEALRSIINGPGDSGIQCGGRSEGA